jgi:hypothetical protein
MHRVHRFGSVMEPPAKFFPETAPPARVVISGQWDPEQCRFTVAAREKETTMSYVMI